VPVVGNTPPVQPFSSNDSFAEKRGLRTIPAR
jgi:hypothetical protein